MGESVKRKAKKDHRCSLCALVIAAGDEYIYQRITPWDHAENDSFSDYKAHVDCDALWSDVGSDCDWMLPAGRQEWLESIGEDGLQAVSTGED
jgi:hypothetical protein